MGVVYYEHGDSLRDAFAKQFTDAYPSVFVEYSWQGAVTHAEPVPRWYASDDFLVIEAFFTMLRNGTFVVVATGGLHVCGHSAGGYMALALAVAVPRCKRLSALVAASVTLEPVSSPIYSPPSVGTSFPPRHGSRTRVSRSPRLPATEHDARAPAQARAQSAGNVHDDAPTRPERRCRTPLVRLRNARFFRLCSNSRAPRDAVRKKYPHSSQ